MGKKFMRIALLCFSLAVLLTASAAATDIVASGACGANGDNVTWALDNRGTLTIGGGGAMANYSIYFFAGDSTNTPYSNAPWDGEKRSITEIMVTNGVTVIGENAFLGCESATKVTIPDSVVRIKSQAFRRCTSLTRVTLPNSIASIEDGTFQQCSNLVSITMPDGIASIGTSAFQDCDHLTRMTIPESVTNLGGSAFRGCNRLQSVTILGGITLLKASTFRDCPVLQEITIPDSVAVIDEYAFQGCSALKDVYFTGTQQMWEEISVEPNNQSLEGADVHFDTSLSNAYRINAVSVSDSGGKSLSAIPDGLFLVTVSITNRASSEAPLVFLAAYDANGAYQGLLYVSVEESVGTTVRVTLPVDNSNGKIQWLKAFVITSFADFTPLGTAVSFPAA